MRNDGHRFNMVTAAGTALSSLLFTDRIFAAAFDVRTFGDIRETRPLIALSTSETEMEYMSHIASIRCRNFAGSTGVNGGDLTLEMSSCEINSQTQLPNLVAVTGETGHGKVRTYVETM